jgi:hypothetical protein
MAKSIKENLVKPLFLNKAIIKGKSVMQRAKKINDELAQIPTMS